MAMLGILANMLGIFKSGDKTYDDLWRWRRRLHAALSKANIHNVKTRLKWDMLRSPARRAKVLQELGGEPALHKWEGRMQRYIQRSRGPMPLRIHRRADMDSLRAGIIEPVRIAGPVPTDSSGYFRLAPIPRPESFVVAVSEVEKQERKEARRLRATLRRIQWEALPFEERYKPRGGGGMFGPEYVNESGNRCVYAIRPIPLTPGELRGPVNNCVIPHMLRDPGSIEDGDLSGCFGVKVYDKANSACFEEVPHLVRDDIDNQIVIGPD